MCDHLFGMYSHRQDADLMRLRSRDTADEDIEYINDVCGNGLELFEFCPKCGEDLKSTDEYKIFKMKL